MPRHFLVLTALLLTACPDPGSDDDGGTADGTGGDIDVPTDAAGMATWLSDESYSGWASESAIHDQTGTSPHGRVLTYFNADLAGSFDAGNTTHPVGSASVKELYDAMDMRVGWAVMVKVEDGDAPQSWYWYLDNAGSVMDGAGLGGCEGCHSAGTDRVLTPYPFQ